jgi:hypothetical protein
VLAGVLTGVGAADVHDELRPLAIVPEAPVPGKPVPFVASRIGGSSGGYNAVGAATLARELSAIT